MARRNLLRTFSALPAGLKRRIVGVAKPSYTVAAMVRIVRPDGALLVVRTSYREGWVFPGGLCDRGESPMETAVREVREEVGLVIDLDGHPIVLVDPGMRRMDFVFEAGIDDRTAQSVVLDPAEIAEHR
ncbi:MAG: NUDIX domain-containing protein, partial [Acidimicrobiales bacterium]